MPITPARAIYEAAETAIYELIVQGKSVAQFQGSSYTALDISKLRAIAAEYRQIAIQRGEIELNPREGLVNVSTARITGGC